MVPTRRFEIFMTITSLLAGILLSLIRAALAQRASSNVPAATNKGGWAATLHLAASWACRAPVDWTLKVVFMLIETGAYVNTKVRSCETALTIVIGNEFFDLTQLLLDIGAASNAKIVSGGIAMTITTQTERHELVQMLQGSAWRSVSLCWSVSLC
jgi:hypothetical protein